jgi:fatty-acid desaturase
MKKLSKFLTTISKTFWFQFVPAIILGLLTIVLLTIGIIPLYYLWSTLIMWILVCGLGIAVGYHRIFSHKTHELPRWKENIILFFASFAGQGAVYSGLPYIEVIITDLAIKYRIYIVQ